MKIDINQIPQEGLELAEELSAKTLELENEIIDFRGTIRITANIYRITNVITAHITLIALMYVNCSRCLSEFEIDFRKNLELNYPVDKTRSTIDLNPDIREEIILDYPIKPLCSPACKGLCASCGKNLNEGNCVCFTL